MTDLRDPATRAEVCFSCHVGNRPRGRSSRTRCTPRAPAAARDRGRHVPRKRCRRTGSKPGRRRGVSEGRRTSRKTNHVDFVGAPGDQGRRDRRGGRAPRRDAAARRPGRARRRTPWAAGKTWPDYAQFDCYACHHDLQAPGYPAGGRRGVQAPLRRHGLAGRPRAAPSSGPGRWPWPGSRWRRPRTPAGDAFRDAVEGPVRGLRRHALRRPGGRRQGREGTGEMVARDARRARRKSRFDSRSSPARCSRCSPRPRRTRSPTTTRPGRSPGPSRRSMPTGSRSPRTTPRSPTAIAELDRLLKLDPYAGREPRTSLVTAEKLDRRPLRDALLRLSEDEFKVSLARAAGLRPGRRSGGAEATGTLAARTGRRDQVDSAERPRSPSRPLPRNVAARRRPVVAVDGVAGVVADLPGPAVVEVEPALLVGAEGPGADPAEDADLVAALVDGAVAVEALRDRQGVARRRGAGNVAIELRASAGG